VAAQIARDRPQTIIDVHRDAIPDPNSYITEVNGQKMTKVRLVVGRQNQNRDANLAYAKRIKAVADKQYPGLIKGIFNAKGNYNQDIGPRTILLEFGTHTTTLEEAKRSAQLMAKVLPAAAGMTPGTAGPAGQQIGGAATKTFLWILGIAIVGGLAWVFLNKEGLRRR
jgi:stage II sporulation protein P